MYWRKAKLNPSLARFENTLEKKMKANLTTQIKKPDNCLVPFSRTSSWNTQMVWSKIAHFHLLVFNEQTRHWKILSYPFLITIACEVQNYGVADSSQIEQLSGLTIIVLRKAAISFITSVRTEQLVSHWLDFHEIWYTGIFL
jgi:hypothetical protein